MRLIKLTVMLVMVTALAGCSDDGDGDATDVTDGAGGGGEALIEVTEIAYPTGTEVPAGGSVRWLNSSGVPHTVVFDTQDDAPVDQAELDLPADGEATATLEPGNWTYHCGIHPSMVGSLIVEG